jgi:hypothetical protein
MTVTSRTAPTRRMQRGRPDRAGLQAASRHLIGHAEGDPLSKLDARRLIVEAD